MRKILFFFLIFLFSIQALFSQIVTASFNAPDTVCVNSPVNILNTSQGGSSYYWSFCAADFNTIPEAVNIGNPSGVLSSPVFGCYALDDNGNFYGLVMDYNSGELSRLNFGNSLLNIPTGENLGNLGGALPEQAEGIQLLRINGEWDAIMVGGGNGTSNSSPRVVKIYFGNSLANTPVATNWGNVGGLNLPHDFYMSQESGNYYGFAINVNDNTITRINFGPDLNGTPTGVNFGNIGNIDYPAGFTFIKNNGNWFAYIANRVTNSITRLDFGSSLLNTPSGINIGNPGGFLDYPRDISIFNTCNEIDGFVVNETSNEIVKLNFGTDPTSVPQATDLGNIGDLSFPHSISDFFRVGNDIYAFIPNVISSSLTRIRFAGCQNIPGSIQQNPPAVSYPQIGTYNINLLVDLGLPTQISYCKKVVVLDVNLTKVADTSICAGAPVQLVAGGGNVYSWTPASTLNNPSVNNPVATPSTTTTYHLAVTNSYGCKKADSIKVTVNSLPVITKSNDTSVCNDASVQLSAGGGTAYSWMPASSLNTPTVPNPVATPSSTTLYYVTVTNSNGCAKKDSIKINTSVPAVITKSADENICKGTSVQISANGGASYSWSPASSLSDTYISNPIASPFSSTTYYVVVDNGYGCTKKDSVKVSVYPVPDITISNDTSICNSSSVKLFVAGGRSYLWSPSSSLDNPVSSAPVASPLINTLYKVAVTDAYSCSFQDSVNISIKPLAVFTVSPDASVCTLTPKQLIAAGGDTYLWSPSDGLNQINIPNPIATPDATTVYYVTIVESVCNQTATLSTTLTALSLPSVHATSSNDLTCSLGSSQLNASGAESYTWSPSSGLNNNNVPNPVATPATTTLYHVSGKDNNGCTGSDTVTVKTDYNMNALYLLPNSFTPNGDGLNDCFGIKYWGVVTDLEFSIYNRFGQKVFYTNNAANCWDGTYKQQPQDADVFIYTITAKTACGLINRKGSVTLIR